MPSTTSANAACHSTLTAGGRRRTSPAPLLVGSAGLQATAFKANGNDLTVSGALSYRF
jgi:hypothetical protein